MFTKYEKELKVILKHYYDTSERTFSTVNSTKEDLKKYEYLAAKGLLNITHYTNGDTNCRINITDAALLYFDEKKDKIFRFLLPIVLSILALIISIVSIALTIEPQVQEVRILNL